MKFLADKDNVDKLKSLLQSSKDNVQQIVDGAVDGASEGLGKVSTATYDTLEKATPLALTFIATQLGVDGIPKALKGVLDKLDLRAYVYAAAYKLAEKAKAALSASALTPAPLTEKVAIGNGQQAWVALGTDGQPELLVGDPKEEVHLCPAEERHHHGSRG